MSVDSNLEGFSEPTESVELVLVPPTRDLGDGFHVKRALPSARRRMVGPFIFVDQMGPAVLTAGKGLDVRPHPHIGLATVTYLFEGEILHRDTLGSVQPVRPGEVNWMIAGRGIAHSERTAPEMRAKGSTLFGLQVWVALPEREEEHAPAFTHHSAESLPVVEGEGASMRLIAGTSFGKRSPVATLSEMFYGDVTLEPGARFALPPEHEERALYLVEGALEVNPGRSVFPQGQLVILQPGVEVVIRAVGEATRARFVVLGGASLGGARHIWWNFVSSSRERIEVAKEDWREGKFGKVPGDEKEFIPLPEGPPPAPVRYP